MRLPTNLSSADSANMRLRNAVFCGEPTLAVIAGENFGNLLVGKASVPMIKAVIVATLYCCISIVLRMRASAQMIRVNAWRIVASVQNDFTRRYWAFEKLICITMCADRHFAGHQKNTVSVAVLRAGPKPAGLHFFNAIEKNILRSEYGIFCKVAETLFSRITRAAQFAPDSLRAAAPDAKQFTPNLVCHGRSFDVSIHFMLYPWRRQL